MKKPRINRPKRLKLKEWSQLEGIRKEMQEWAKQGGWFPIAEIVIKLIRKCGVWGRLEKKPWFKVAELYMECHQINLPRVKFPMLTETKSEDGQIPWDYIGRDWYWWVNLFAKNYGWKESDIESLDIDDAIGLYQEILVQEQLEKEWQYGLSELAYEYVPSTKKSKFKPLTRPSWMLVTEKNYKKKPIKTTKIPISMMPVGNVVKLDDE